MNRINRKHMNAVTTYLWYIHFNSQNTIAESEYQRAIREVRIWCAVKEVRIWCAIRESIRKGYKRVKE